MIPESRELWAATTNSFSHGVDYGIGRVLGWEIEEGSTEYNPVVLEEYRDNKGQYFSPGTEWVLDKYGILEIFIFDDKQDAYDWAENEVERLSKVEGKSRADES